MTLTPEELADVVAAVRADMGAPVVDPHAVGGFRQVVSGATILADDMNTALVNGVPKFPSAAARDAQWPTPPVGAMCWLADVAYGMVYSKSVSGGALSWRVSQSLRQGYAQMAHLQQIPTAAETRLKISAVGGVANKAGRATWVVGQDHVTVPVAGTYLVVADVRWQGNPTGERVLWIKRSTDGTTYGFSGVSGGAQELNSPGGGTDLRQSVSALISCGANNRIAMSVYQKSGVTLTMPEAGPESCTMAVHLMGGD